MKKFLSAILALSMLFSICVLPAQATSEDPRKAAFDALPEDAIVCYMYGQPVYKCEVDENGYVDKDFGNQIQTRASASVATIPSMHRGESIVAGCNMVTTGFSQQEQILYYPVDKAVKLAQKFENASGYINSVSIAAGAVGLATFKHPYVSMASGVISLIAGLGSTAIAQFPSRIREYTDEGDAVQVEVVNSQYGTFYTVNYWNLRTCIRDGYSINGVTVTMLGAYCSSDSHDNNVWG